MNMMGARIMKACTEVDQQIGGRLRLLRLQRGKSQGWLGAQLGLTFQQVQKYEKGTNRISGSRMAQIAAVLDVQPAYFFGQISSADRETAEKVTEVEWIQLMMEHGAIDLLRDYRAMPIGERAALRNLARAMVESKPMQ
jgi:transcriptional regulator with XRE-family HTH domain